MGSEHNLPWVTSNPNKDTLRLANSPRIPLGRNSTSHTYRYVKGYWSKTSGITFFPCISLCSYQFFRCAWCWKTGKQRANAKQTFQSRIWEIQIQFLTLHMLFVTGDNSFPSLEFSVPKILMLNRDCQEGNTRVTKQGNQVVWNAILLWLWC